MQPGKTTLMMLPLLRFQSCWDLFLMAVALGFSAVMLSQVQAQERVDSAKAQARSGSNASAPKEADLPIVEQKDAPAWGKFVAFHGGTLTLRGNTAYMVWRNLSPSTGVSQWSEPAHQYLPFGTLPVLTNVSQGTWVFVAENRSRIQVGAGKESHVSGTFLSFAGERLLMGGSELGNYASENGSKLHFPKFVEGIPVYTNMDGKVVKSLGPAEKVLPHLKAGQRITVYGEGDFNFTKIELGPVEQKK